MGELFGVGQINPHTLLDWKSGRLVPSKPKFARAVFFWAAMI
ncbi:hypothetical protein FM102_10565 [Corynebacterium glutamicum]|nr:hypothetical protein FM102_10565 [Corynebacterium glutamicum]